MVLWGILNDHACGEIGIRGLKEHFFDKLSETAGNVLGNHNSILVL